MRKGLTGLIGSIVNALWPLATEIWEAWGIQLLVVSSFTCQIILVHLGGRRRHCDKGWMRAIVWASYLLASNIATIALGKLTVVTIRNTENPEYNIELQALLAPLLLMHLANPDSISAYAVEDTRMARRRALMLLVQACFVIWILVRCFDRSSPISKFLYIPLFIAGIIKPITTVFALASPYDDTVSVDELRKLSRPTSQDKDDDDISVVVPHKISQKEMMREAYHRFNCLQPHRANWIHHSEFLPSDLMSLDWLLPEDAFTVIEMELGFVYDAIYTQLPVVCTQIGLVGRAISIICMVSTLTGLSIIYRNAFLLDVYVAYTYAILMGSIIMELYQTISLPFFYTAVIALQEWVKGKHCEKISKFLVKVCDGEKISNSLVNVCTGQKVWSNSLKQLNFVECYLKGDFPELRNNCPKLLNSMKYYWSRIKIHWRSTPKVVEVCLKKAIINKMKELEEEGRKNIAPFENRGHWTVDHCISTREINLEKNILKASMEREFDKCIIIWHIATDILLSRASPDNVHSLCSTCCCNRSPSPSQVSKDPGMMCTLLSHYMMYLLMDHPYMLALTTGDITSGYVCSTLKALEEPTITRLQPRKEKLMKDIMEKTLPLDVLAKDYYNTIITKNWDVLTDVKQLVNELEKLDHSVKWELISGVWIEMLCYAADKTQVYQHMTMLRKGGELITHVWLLLRHKTRQIP